MSASLAIMIPIYILFLVSCWPQSGECTTNRRKQAKTAGGHEEDLPFSYDPKSPHAPPFWEGDCQNDKQSPINIRTELVEYESKDKDQEKISYEDNSRVSGEFENNGHTASFTVDDHGEEQILVNVPDFDPKYEAGGKKGKHHGTGEDKKEEDGDVEWVFHNTHFHIGGVARNPDHSRFPPPGSEHAVDGHRYDGEIHLVHWRRDEHTETFEEAASKDDGLLVVGIFFNVVKGKKHEGEADRIIQEYVSEIVKPHTETSASVNPSLLLPKDGLFYRYKGSTTTPPCSENVFWIVHKTPITISRKSYGILKRLITEEMGHPRLIKFGNNRPIQRDFVLGVQANFHSKKSGKHLLRRFWKKLRKELKLKTCKSSKRQ